MVSKMVLLSVLLDLFTCYVYSQDTIDYQNNDQVVDDSIPGKNVSYSFTTGVSVFSGKHIGTGSVFFFSPGITYNFSPRLIINSGLIVNQNNYSIPVAFIGDNRSMTVRQTPVANQNVFYASGDYALSSRLFFSGSISSTFGAGTNTNTQEANLRNYFQSMTVGMSYKVNKNLTISAGMGIVHSNDVIDIPGNSHSNKMFNTEN